MTNIEKINNLNLHIDKLFKLIPIDLVEKSRIENCIKVLKNEIHQLKNENMKFIDKKKLEQEIQMLEYKIQNEALKLSKANYDLIHNWRYQILFKRDFIKNYTNHYLKSK